MQNRKYIKYGDFNEIKIARDYYRLISYVNTSHPKPPQIYQFKVANTLNNAIKFMLYFLNSDIAHRFLLGCPESLRSHIHPSTTPENTKDTVYDIETSDKRILKEIIISIDQFDPVDDETISELEKILCLSKIIRFDSLIQLIHKNDFANALTLALEDETLDTVWKLAHYCEKNSSIDLQNALQCYQLITPTHPRYHEANDIMLHLYLSIDTNEMDETEKRELLEIKFACALNSGNRNSTLASHFFHELCGYHDLTPNNQQIAGDAKTLIALAKQICDLTHENQKLKKEVAQLRAGENTPPNQPLKFFNR